MRAVMDTNVLFAGLRSRQGAGHQLLRLLSQRRWTLVLSNTLLTEYQEVLHREQKDSSGMHSVCVCQIHQNLKLQISAHPERIDIKDIVIKSFVPWIPASACCIVVAIAWNVLISAVILNHYLLLMRWKPMMLLITNSGVIMVS